MEFSPIQPELSTYQLRAVSLVEKADKLMTARQVEHLDGNDRFQTLHLSQDEITFLSPIFDSHILDTPEAIKITFGSEHTLDTPKPRLKCSEILMICTKYEDISANYYIWVEPKEREIVIFEKEVIRTIPSAEPYRIGPFVTEAVIHNIIFQNAFVEEHEQEALQELLDHLLMRSSVES